MSTRKALFLDRDGVINHDKGYTSRIEDFFFIDGIFDLCRAAIHSGYLLVVVTNQAGIGRGYYSETDFLSLTEWMCTRFKNEGILISDVLFCPYHPEHGVGSYKRHSPDRKPSPGMLLKALKKHDLDMANSIMVGDKESDMQAASKAGVGTRCKYLDTCSPDTDVSISTHNVGSLREVINLL